MFSGLAVLLGITTAVLSPLAYVFRVLTVLLDENGIVRHQASFLTDRANVGASIRWYRARVRTTVCSHPVKTANVDRTSAFILNEAQPRACGSRSKRTRVRRCR